MAEQQRKIELQSPDDLQYLVVNVKRVAKEMIDRDLPPIEGEDAMRTLVEEIVSEYIQKTFNTASPSISINGMSPPRKLLDQTHTEKDIIEEREEHEPFDGQLWEKAKALAIREEELVEQVAALRRNVPGVVVEREGGWKRGVEGEEMEIEGWREKLGEDDDDDDGGGLDLGLQWNERQVQVEGDWERGITGLQGLKRGLPEVGARRERVGRAEEYVRGTGRKG
ncbi:hypothetical protein SBOR_9267 [Sclerotinia borealis F-4128]|uniref:Kinetochore protein mis14 n=1 Tax=Sclerotinia borealis (strain F-4128) TaxID=1432307 RepID=W9C3T8_SCLBF|nr:hypothetical protein SBOR_9267 [Sclerotinia borealis F-4128]